jgi:hypothetical protein
MTKLNDLTTSQIRSIIEIKEQIETLQSQIDAIAVGGDETSAPSTEAMTVKKKHKMSRAGRAAIAAGARARWAKIKGTDTTTSDKPAKRRKMSAAAKAKISAAAKARWAKARLEGKKGL